MDSLSNSQIDAAIMSVAEVSWRKIAFVISKVTKVLHSDMPEGNSGYSLVAERIEALVRDGRLLAQGDIKKWRHSEVRKPN